MAAADFTRVAAAKEGSVAGGVPGACGDVTLTQSTNNNLVTSGISCVISGATGETGWARAFPIAPGPNFVVNCVDFGVTQNVGPDFVVTVNLFTGNPTGPYGSLVPLASLPVAVPSGTVGAILTADFFSAMGGVTVPGGATLVVEILAPTRIPAAGGDGGLFFAGTNAAGQTAPSFIRSPDCGAPDFVDLAAIGFPNEHLVMRVDGGPLWWTAIEVINNSGLPAADLELKLAGGGGTLFVPPGLIIAPGCPAATVPTNTAGVGDDIKIDWGALCVPPDARVILVVRSASGPLSFVSGTWTSLGGIPIGGVSPSRLSLTPLGIGINTPKQLIAIKRYIRYLDVPVYGKWTKPPGQCWQRWCCTPAGGRLCQDRFEICFFPDPLSRFLERGNCRPLGKWRTFDINLGVIWYLQVTTIKPPPNEPQLPPGGPLPEKPDLFAMGFQLIDHYDLEVFESDDDGLTVQASTDFADAFFGLFDRLRIVGDDPTLPPILGLPALLQAMSPSYALAAEGLDEVLAALDALLLEVASPELDAARDATVQLRSVLFTLANLYVNGVTGPALLYFTAGNALRIIGDSLLAASGGEPRFVTARGYLHDMAEGMDVSAQAILTGLPTPIEQDTFLWGQVARLQPMAESAGLSLLNHIRIPLDLQLPSWGPETAPVQVLLLDAAGDSDGLTVLDDQVHRLNEFGELLLLNQLGPDGTYLLWTKAPTHLAVIQTVLAIDGFTTPTVTLVNGDADGNNCVNITDQMLVLADQGEGGEFALEVPSTDVNRNGIVTLDDLAIVNAALGLCGEPYPMRPPDCLGDLNDDGVVNGADLGILLGAWDTPNADLNGDGTTNGADLGILLGAFGPCP